MIQRSRRRLLVSGAIGALATGALITMPSIAHATAAGTVSSKVAYVTSQSSGANGGYDIFDAMNQSSQENGGTGFSDNSTWTYTTKSGTAVTVTDLDTADLTTTSKLSGYDTVVLYEACDIATGATSSTAIPAVNAFVNGGGKLIILDGGWCTTDGGGVANWSTFVKPFSDKYGATNSATDPHDASTKFTAQPYSFVETETSPALTTGEPDCGSSGCAEPGNSLYDASTLNESSTGWCDAANATDANGVLGPVEAYAHGTGTTPGLIVYEGEAFAAGFGQTTTDLQADYVHLRTLFDNFLKQPANPDSLPCSAPLTPGVNVPEVPLGVLIPLAGLVVIGGAVGLSLVARTRRRVIAA